MTTKERAVLRDYFDIDTSELLGTQLDVKEWQKDLTFYLGVKNRHSDNPEITELCISICRGIKTTIRNLWDFYKFTEEEEVRQSEYKRKMLYTTLELPFTG